MEKCNCYHTEYNKEVCYGTKEREECSCGGDETKCNFYTEKREVAKKRMEEKYYWKQEDGTLIPVHELTDLHICNITMKFGKDRLHDMGHSVIADKFAELNREYKFFDKVK